MLSSTTRPPARIQNIMPCGSLAPSLYSAAQLAGTADEIKRNYYRSMSACLPDGPLLPPPLVPAHDCSHRKQPPGVKAMGPPATEQPSVVSH
jgi:hypothetical protein